MAVTARIAGDFLTADETLTLGLDLATDPTFPHKFGNTKLTLNASSTPAVSKVFSDTVSLSSGTVTLDLTSLAGPNSTTIDGTGLKVQAIEIANPSTNTAAVVVAPASSNGYNLAGDGSEQITVADGGRVGMYMPEGSPDIGASAKDIDITSTDQDASVNVIIVMG